MDENRVDEENRKFIESCVYNIEDKLQAIRNEVSDRGLNSYVSKKYIEEKINSILIKNIVS